MPRSRKLAFDIDTALHDEQWEKLSAFLKPMLSEEDFQTVEDICRGGGDAPEKTQSGASDAARRPPRERADVPRVNYDTKTFPHSGRLR